MTIDKALTALDRLRSFAKSNDDNKFHHFDKIDALTEQVRQALQSRPEAQITPRTMQETEICPGVKVWMTQEKLIAWKKWLKEKTDE